MAEELNTLFPADMEALTAPQHSTGLLPSQAIRELIRERGILSAETIGEDQIQPASLDLRLGGPAYRVRASFLPGPEATVREKIEALGMHEIDLSGGAVLEKGCVYIVPLMEGLRLGKRVYGVANPKSSTGRLDLFTRLITDHAIEFDRVRGAYKGPLYAEISPRAFSVLVRQGSRLIQLRLRRGSPPATDTQLKKLHEEIPLVHSEGGEDDVAKRISKGIPVTVDLGGSGGTGGAAGGAQAAGGLEAGFVGYKAKAHAGLIDVDAVSRYDALEYWEPIAARAGGTIILDPRAFYILASREAVTVPPDHAAEMVPFNPLQGEFRVHYAGFFDPGFGYSESGGAGSRAVLEVRSFEVPFLLEHGQVVGRLIYERLTDVPDKIYGTGIGSSYQRQGLRLSKQFKG